MRSKETVLVTAAAGGTGQFAVQLAKLAGNTVVATCGSDDKAQLLTQLGCDRVINYNKEQPKVLLEGTSTHVLYIHASCPAMSTIVAWLVSYICLLVVSNIIYRHFQL